MILYIGHQLPNASDVIHLKTICDVKKLDSNQTYDIVIDDYPINQYGLIKGTDIFIEELLLSLKIARLITSQPIKRELVAEWQQAYHIEVHNGNI